MVTWLFEAQMRWCVALLISWAPAVTLWRLSLVCQDRSGWGSYQFATLVAKNVWKRQEMTSTSSTYPPRAFSSPCGKERLQGKQRGHEVYQHKNRDVLSSKVSQVSENKTSNKLFIRNLLHHRVKVKPISKSLTATIHSTPFSSVKSRCLKNRSKPLCKSHLSCLCQSRSVRSIVGLWSTPPTKPFPPAGKQKSVSSL